MQTKLAFSLFSQVQVIAHYCLVALTLLGTLLSMSKIRAEENKQSTQDTEFDMGVITSRGLDPSLMALFRQAPHFMPGQSTVALTVNGSERGKFMARFDDNGQLCADGVFFKQARLKHASSDSADTCADLKELWPQTELTLDPAEGRVELVVPPQAIAFPGIETGNWTHGGLAGMLNYDAQYMDSAGAAAGVNFMQLGTEAGFNANDWIVRSRQTLTRLDGVETMQHQAAYAQRSFLSTQQVFQAGQVSLSNSMFGTGQVIGFQVFPEASLRSSLGGPGLVEGVADIQSIVEVRQSGVLVHSTTVPAGPFRLQGLSLLNTRSDLEVTLTGSNGEKRQFIVPASALLLNGNAVAPGLSFGIGRLEQQGSSESPMLGTVANGWVLSPRTVLNVGLLGSTAYRAGALRLDAEPWNTTQLSIQAMLSQDVTNNYRGTSFTSSLSRNLTERTSVVINASQQSGGYRELSDALQEEYLENPISRSLRQYGAGVSWSTETFGSLSLSLSRGTTFEGDNTTFLRGSWSRQFGDVYIGASVEQNSGTSAIDAEKRLYLTLNIPFGNRTVSSYVSNTSNSSLAGVRYSDRTSRDRGWSLSSERDLQNRRVSNSGTVDMVTPISQLGGSLSRDSDNYTSWSVRATGAVVGHADGVTLSPYRVGDTFGIAKVGEEAGVKVDTSSGTTWTDASGYAVIPSLAGFKRSNVQVDTQSLSKNVDIANAWHETEAARGSVSYINFDIARTRRVLVDVRDRSGEYLPHGASVFDEAGNFVTIVNNREGVFIPDAGVGVRFEVQRSGKRLCSFSLHLPEEPNVGGFYESASAQCR
ncbi:fimbria/pilus outer membrane usher protein [Pseudomonas fluorescens]|uniref:fimbria/pilus outer membrane usher protein n=1 Tax=Pseudomonas fluorescens TaxID=294 RepID=UPI003CFD5786